MVQYLSGNVEFLAPAAIDRQPAAKISIKVSTLRNRFDTTGPKGVGILNSSIDL